MTTIKPVTGTVKLLAYMKGAPEKEVPATLYGALVVHKAESRRGGSWRVTHAPSGMALTSTINDFATKREAVACALRFLALPIDWNVGEVEIFMTVRNRDTFDALKAALKG